MGSIKTDGAVDGGYDVVIERIVDYAYNFQTPSEAALKRAKIALLDSLGAAVESLMTSKECEAMIVGRSIGVKSRNKVERSDLVSYGFSVSDSTQISQDILKAAFDLGAMIRYLDHNDAFAGAEWGHPSGE